MYYLHGCTILAAGAKEINETEAQSVLMDDTKTTQTRRRI